jgi:hypothetical protein
LGVNLEAYPRDMPPDLQGMPPGLAAPLGGIVIAVRSTRPRRAGPPKVRVKKLRARGRRGFRSPRTRKERALRGTNSLAPNAPKAAFAFRPGSEGGFGASRRVRKPKTSPANSRRKRTFIGARRSDATIPNPCRERTPKDLACVYAVSPGGSGRSSRGPFPSEPFPRSRQSGPTVGAGGRGFPPGFPAGLPPRAFPGRSTPGLTREACLTASEACPPPPPPGRPCPRPYGRARRRRPRLPQKAPGLAKASGSKARLPGRRGFRSPRSQLERAIQGENSLRRKAVFAFNPSGDAGFAAFRRVRKPKNKP